MNRPNRRLIPALVLLLSGAGLLASDARATGGAGASLDEVWTRLDRIPSSHLNREPRFSLRAYRLFKLDRWRLDAILARAPRELPQAALGADVVLSLPMPDGSFARFRIAESPLMAPALAAKFPQIRTYAGQGMDDPRLMARFDWTPRGFHAQILSPDGAIYINRYWDREGDLYASYNRRDQVEDAEPFRCHARSDTQRHVQPLPAVSDPGIDAQAAITALQSGETLTTYRLAVAVTGEYTALHSQPEPANVADGLSAVVATVNAISGIFEAELTVRLELVAANDLIVYTDPETDPYTNDDVERMIAENAQTLGRVIGEDSYDIGHVFGTGGGGVAWYGVACGGSGKKDRGASGPWRPIGDPDDIMLVAHEIGHQFNALHTYNSPYCPAMSYYAQSAMEPGSGSTLMAYSSCGPDWFQGRRDPYYHSISYDQIREFVTVGGGRDCAIPSPTGNLAPVVDAGPDYTIPRQTPFVLTASGTDPDGDPLTFSWEERDLGPRRSLDDPDNGRSPLFRAYAPTPGPARTFPRLSAVLGNFHVRGEDLPDLPRIMTFRVTARDNRPLGAGIGWDEMQVTVTDLAGPFRVTAPATEVIWWGNQMVRWDPSGTDRPPVSAGTVNILLSVDGGSTYPYLLAAGTPNDGSESVTLPDLYAPYARIRVEAADNIFFDVSDLNLTVLTEPGEVSPPGAVGPFRIDWLVAGFAQLRWSAPGTGASPERYLLYAYPIGERPALASCVADLGTGTSIILEGIPDDREFVVVARNIVGEGSYGRDSSGAERPKASGVNICP